MNTLFFYKDNRISNVLQCGVSGRTVLQVGERILAELGGQETTRLQAVDEQRSVLCSSNKKGETPIAYAPYGAHQRELMSANLLSFAGERRDACVDHYFLGKGYRTYSPNLMRFLSADAWSPFGTGGINSYAYCSGDPVNFSDPSGHGGLSVRRSIDMPVVQSLVKLSAKKLPEEISRLIPGWPSFRGQQGRNMVRLFRDVRQAELKDPISGLSVGLDGFAEMIFESSVMVSEAIGTYSTFITASHGEVGILEIYKKIRKDFESSSVMAVHRAKILDVLDRSVSRASSEGVVALVDVAAEIERSAFNIRRDHRAGKSEKLIQFWRDSVALLRR